MAVKRAAITAELCAGWSTAPSSPPSSGHRGIPSPPPGPSSPPPSSSTSPSPSSTASTSSSPLPSSVPSPPHTISSYSPSHSSWPPAAGCSLSAAAAALPSRRHLFCFPTTTPPASSIFCYAYVFYLSKLLEFSDTLPSSSAPPAAAASPSSMSTTTPPSSSCPTSGSITPSPCYRSRSSPTPSFTS